MSMKLVILFLCIISFNAVEALAPLEPPDGSLYFGPWYERLNGDYPTAINNRLGFNLSFFHSDFNLTDDCQPQEIDMFLEQVYATRTNAIVYMTIYPMKGFRAVTDAALQTLTLKIVEAVSRGTRIFIRYASEMNGNWFAYGQRPLEFLESWKWVVSTIRKATNYSENVAFIWAPNSGNGYPFPLGEYFISKYEEPEQFDYLDTNRDGILDIKDDCYTPYYPGDEWVDWVGFSIYHYGSEYPWEQNVLPPPGKFEAIMVGDLDYNATFHFYEMFSGSGQGGEPVSRSKGGKPFIVTETGATYHLAKKDELYWFSLKEGPGRVAIKQTWWRQYLNSTFLNMYPKLKAVSTFEFTKFEETTWRDFTNMGDTGTGINSPFGNDAGPSDGPVLEALKRDLSVFGKRIQWANIDLRPKNSKQAANSAKPVIRNYILLIAAAEGMFWSYGAWTKTGLFLVIGAIVLKASLYSIEYIAMMAKIYLKRAELEKVDKKELDNLLIYCAGVGCIGYCLLVNGFFSGLFCLWMLASDGVNTVSMPKLTVPVNGIKWFTQEHSKQSVFHRGVFLGVITGVGLVISLTTSARGIGVYLVFLSVFHLLEYVCLAINTTQVTLDAFLLNHSKEYHVAVIASVLEYLLEWHFFKSMKSWSWITNVGILIAVGGQLLRSFAMITAKSNFTHIVRRSKVEGHQLVKTGVYRYFCHPSYTGFFYWAASLQLILMNPICFLAYIKTLANFFSERLETEEESLIEFFGQEYIDYRRDTWLLIPEI